MKPKFQITKVNAHYVIKKRVTVFPFFYLRKMDKAEFNPIINDYGYSVMESQLATFKTVEQCFGALSQWASINGVEEIVVKVVDRL
jgi:hypothetical protein